MNNQEWKLKYQDLKLKFLDAVDVSFRLGFEQGAQQAQVQQAEMATQQAQMTQGQPGQDPNAQFGQETSDGSELDQHIGTLENMLSQSKSGSPEQEGLQKSLDGIKAFKSNLKQSYEFKKSELAIKAIEKAMKPKFVLGKAATKNLSPHGVKGINDQEKIVADLMKAMDEEEKKVAESITKTLSLEQILKG